MSIPTNKSIRQVTYNGTIIPLEQSGVDMGSWDLIANSVDENGDIYNGGLGYKDGYRLNSSGAEVVQANSFITGFISVPTNWKQLSAYIEPKENYQYIYNICRFDASKTFIAQHTFIGYVGSVARNSVASSPVTSFIRVTFRPATSLFTPPNTNSKVKIV